MVQIYSWLHSTFKYLSNDTSHAQIQVKMKKLWLRQVGQRKLSQQRKLCRDKDFFCNREILSRQRKFCRDQIFCCNRANSIATKFSVAIEKLWLRQRKLHCNRVFCRNRENLSQQSFLLQQKKLCLNEENSVTTEKTMSRQKNYVGTEKLCRDRKTVATKKMEKTKKDRKWIFWLVFKLISPCDYKYSFF